MKTKVRPSAPRMGGSGACVCVCVCVGGGGGVLGVRTPSPSFGGPPNFIERGKTLHACMRIHHILVPNSYPDPRQSIRLCLFHYRDEHKPCKKSDQWRPAPCLNSPPLQTFKRPILLYSHLIDYFANGRALARE